MMVIGKIMAFLLGMCVSVQVLATFYRILDLWYTIHTEYLNILRSIACWGGVSFFLAVLLGENMRNAFLWGMVFYVPFYFANYFLLRSILNYRFKVKGEVGKKSKNDI
ncbi:MAG: hypothetical protein D3924_08615 [Candidatus Electrothrix sp. AR4]|nr:hypothetical protein [Candidatus Electrothrix sp. AR4]